MLYYPELAMNTKREVTTVCRGECRVWNDREEAKSYFLEAMILTNGEIREHYECVYIQLMNGLDICSDDEEDDV